MRAHRWSYGPFNLDAGDGGFGGEFVVAVVNGGVKVGVEVELKVENVLLLNLKVLFGLPYGGVEDLGYFQQLANCVTVGLKSKPQRLCIGPFRLHVPLSNWISIYPF